MHYKENLKPMRKHDENIDPKKIVIEFNHCINNRDIGGLEQLMADNHSFIDSANTVMSGKISCLDAWRGFFQRFPDYKNHFNDMEIINHVVVIVGHSTCSDRILDGPAIWTAKIEDSKVVEWRVYEDTDKNRQLLGLNDE